MIKTYSLTKEYGGEKVLNLSELEIPKGELFGLIGNNGAGKTTFFSLLLDLIEATSGTVEINNIMVHQSEAWKPFISAFIDESYLIGYLTVEEYFYFLGSLREKTQVEVDSWIKAYEPFFNGEILNQKKYLRDFSKGNQKKVGIVGALIGQPEVIVLDEPFANLDPTTQIRLKSLIKEEAMNNGTTFLISSHDLTHVTEVCDRIVLLDKGTVLKDIKKTSSTLKELEQYFSN
jgi:ABC-2 type transport system ATP-binding protein